ncbi:RidA family protein [Mucilaginibacter sp. UR6-1]|uniref:RidA family protein n=1 Tax=Mucilaginibacter sp. UR6-1 TaxID=1435643 RepID=UPI001E3D7B44|nr:RidA family protein [Mucilaginibacter sp. UR6-1]MCC8407830.1 RidA family protein [Mucilaginibacter sp. UR6-1]
MKISLIPLCFTVLLFAGMGCKNKSDSNNNTRRSAYKTADTLKQKWHWDNQHKQNESAGYAQVVKTGNTIYISGVPTSDLSPKGIAGVYKTLEKCLHAFGASPKNVVKETLYTTDIETMKKYNEQRKQFYKGDFPAATWVQVSRLYEADAKLEVELIARLNEIDE